MDMILPGMHGLEATIGLKKDPRTEKISVFAVTAMHSTEFVQACYQDGICVFIKKPYDFRELLAAIEEYTDGKGKDGEKVLVVHDDPAMITLIAVYLGRYGYRVISAPVRMVSCEHIREVRPRVVLLDIGVLEMEGTRVLRELRKACRPSSIPIILTAAQLSSKEMARLSKALGAEDYVPCLFEFDEIDRKIKKVTGG